MSSESTLDAYFKSYSEKTVANQGRNYIEITSVRRGSKK